MEYNKCIKWRKNSQISLHKKFKDGFFVSMKRNFCLLKTQKANLRIGLDFFSRYGTLQNFFLLSKNILTKELSRKETSFLSVLIPH